jgi:hypothetical protein
VWVSTVESSLLVMACAPCVLRYNSTHFFAKRSALYISLQGLLPRKINPADCEKVSSLISLQGPLPRKINLGRFTPPLTTGRFTHRYRCDQQKNGPTRVLRSSKYDVFAV